DIRGDNLPLDEKMEAALRPKGQSSAKPQQVARSFKPTGFADIQAFIRRDGKSPQYTNRYLIKFHHATLCYKVFPYPLENVTGTRDVPSEYWEFHGCRGTHKGGEFRGRGRSVPGPDGERIEVFLDGTNLLLDGELKAATEEDLQRTWTK